jgi:glycosyltransferase involved in cell wall biosynthesis
MRVSVVVPARDAAATLPRTLACLGAQQGAPEFEVVVVDDGSSDRTGDIAREAGVTVIQTEGVGSGQARNLGVQEASGELIAFTDADCFPTAGWLAALAKGAEDADLLAGAVAPDPTTTLGAFDRTVWVERETGLYETANLLIRRELFERIGGFERWLQSAGPKRGWTNPELAEDVWLGWRARRAGARTAFAPDALVHHAVHPRGAIGYVSERRRAEHFPTLAARIPELRDQFFYRRVFLSRRTAMFDAAAAATALAAIAGNPLPLLAAAPYARHLAKRARPFRKRGPLVAAAEVAADAVSVGSLLYGSVRSRSPVF